ncbi:MAG: hypothetical protein V3S14_01125 [Anaerolineae bacterium]
MRDVFRVFWEAIKDWWDELFLLLLMNIVTALLLIPVVTFPPALAGLWNAGNRVAQGRAIGWADYFEGFRRYFLKAWGLALLNILVVVIVLTNVRFYSPDVAPFEISDTASTWISGFFVATGFLWLVVQIYSMAMLLEQEDQRLRVALRNSAVLFIVNPGFTVVLTLLLFLIVVISTIFAIPWVFITLAFFAVVCNKAVLHLLEPVRERIRAEKEEGEQLDKGDSQ